jgi:hypothetical protein
MAYKTSKILRDMAAAIAFILPVVYLVVLIYNPSERAAVKADNDRQGTVSYMGRVIKGSVDTKVEVPYKPDSEDCSGDGAYCYVAIGADFIVYSKATSMAWKEYCSQQETYTLYSSVDNFTGLVCGGTPKVGKQKFANN